MIAFDNSFARLPSQFYTKLAATPVKEPTLRAWNAPLAEALGLSDLSEKDRAAIFGGNATPDGAEPLAALYAGHQFGNWNPQLGDGRALLLGEVLDQNGERWDIQLKGAGRTPYSRMGDGRNWVGPALREYLVSEAMHALGVPTTRALAIVTTGETVVREAPLPGAIVTRVARSHIRVGSFQVFAARQDTEAMRAEVARLSPRDLPGYEKFLRDSEERYEFGFEDLGRRPMNELWELIKVLPRFAWLRADRSVVGHARRRFKDPRLQMAFSFHPLFIGGDPCHVTSMYILVSLLEKEFGVHYAMGGVAAIAEAMESVPVLAGS